MSALLLAFDPAEQSADLVFDDDGFLRTGRDLQTAIAISLFTRASDDLHDSEETRQSGWWADALQEDGVKIGSKLWTLARRKLTPETLSLAKGYAVDALRWLLKDGVASAIDAEVERQGIKLIAMRIVITRAAGEPWEHVWKGLDFSAL